MIEVSKNAGIFPLPIVNIKKVIGIVDPARR
jgi:hypothetical protein